MNITPLSSSIYAFSRSGIFVGTKLPREFGGSLTFRKMSFYKRNFGACISLSRSSISSSSSRMGSINGRTEPWVKGTSTAKTASQMLSTSPVLGKPRDVDSNDEVSNNPFGRDYGVYEKVMPGNVSNVVRKIPDHIEKPDYWKTGHPAVKLGPRNSHVEIKSREAIEKMRKSCALARKVLSAAIKEVKPGITTEQLDDFIFNYTIALDAYPSPLNYKCFPKSVCTSVNNVACHGIPDDRVLVDGDIINIDVMVYLDGYHGDCSETVLVGNVDPKGKKLVEAAKACLDRGILVCGPGVPFRRIGQTIEDVAEEQGFAVVPAFTGHGIGNQIHGPPDIYHYESLVQQENIDNKFIDFPYPGKMAPGMTFTIEPVLTQGMEDVVILPDGWTAVTLDGSRTAQFEHTILITNEGAEILTLD